MSRLKILLMLCLLAAAMKVVHAQSPDLPPGPMQQKARTACLECHDAGIIVQQRLNAAAWGKEVDKMRRWGAFVEDKDRDALVEYFSANFGADKPPLDHSPYQKTPSAHNAPKKAGNNR